MAHVLSPHRRELRLQLSVRRALVETRTQYATTIHGLVRAGGKRLPPCNPENLPLKLAEEPLDAKTRLLTEPLVKLLQELTPQIKQVETKLEQLCEGEPVIEQLKTVPGVTLIVAAAFVSVIDDAKGFQDAHQVEAYLGLVPSEHTSGKRKLGAITKQGNSYMRALLIQSAHCILRLRTDDPLKRWGENVEQRRGLKIAVVAVARRLVGILWAIWRDGTATTSPSSARPRLAASPLTRRSSRQKRCKCAPT